MSDKGYIISLYFERSFIKKKKSSFTLFEFSSFRYSCNFVRINMYLIFFIYRKFLQTTV